MQYANAPPCSKEEKALWMLSRFNSVLGLAFTVNRKNSKWKQSITLPLPLNVASARGEERLGNKGSCSFPPVSLPRSAQPTSLFHSLSEKRLATPDLNVLCKEMLLAVRVEFDT